MVGRPQKRTIETRERILSVSRELFDTQGFDATSVDEIAAKADVGKGTVFAHFTDKTSLLIAVKLEQLKKLIANMTDHVSEDPGDDGVEYLMVMFRPWLKLFRTDRDFTELFLIQGGLKQGPWTNQFIEACQAMENNITAALASLVAGAHLPVDSDVEMRSQGAQAFFYQVVVGYNTGALSSVQEQEELLVALLENWVGPR